ncbi:MAG: methyltransferase, partial [Pseudomonadota bacterium]
MNAVVQPTPIRSLDGYTARMKKTLLDKAFFIDKIDAETVVDYGCADGELIAFLQALFPEKTYVGFDPDVAMLERARTRVPGAQFAATWDDVPGDDAPDGDCADQALVLSSVVHEVYAYSTAEEVRTFWDRVFDSGFAFIALRDMVPSTAVDRRADLNDVARIYRHADMNRLKRFESVWGTIENNKALLHWLLKYRYTDNWEREVEENYLPLYRENLLAMIPDTYEIIYAEHFTLP